MSWCSVTQARDITGRVVTEENLALAHSTIELTAGVQRVVIEEESTTERTLLASDLGWLRRAVAFQAAWLEGQSDYLDREDATAVSADGQSAQFGPDAMVLAPLAKRALMRLSWRGTRSIQMTAGRDILDVNGEAFDNSLPYRPL